MTDPLLSQHRKFGFDKDRLYNAMLYAKETRARYTMLSLMADLGVLEEIAEKVTAAICE